MRAQPGRGERAAGSVAVEEIRFVSGHAFRHPTKSRSSEPLSPEKSSNLLNACLSPWSSGAASLGVTGSMRVKAWLQQPTEAKVSSQLYRSRYFFANLLRRKFPCHANSDPSSLPTGIPLLTIVLVREQYSCVLLNPFTRRGSPWNALPPPPLEKTSFSLSCC
jgi:hypothetical protein